MKRKLTPLCIVLSVLIVLISMISVSFSWFKPSTKSGTGLQFVKTTSVRSENCEITNYSGDKDGNGKFTYTEISDNNTDITIDDIAYFRTVISNNSEYDTNISLFISNMSCTSTGTGVGKYMLAVTFPTNTCREFSETKNDMHIVRNAFVSAYDVNTSGSGSITIDWFIKVTDCEVKINPQHIYITYN